MSDRKSASPKSKAAKNRGKSQSKSPSSSRGRVATAAKGRTKNDAEDNTRDNTESVDDDDDYADADSIIFVINQKDRVPKISEHKEKSVRRDLKSKKTKEMPTQKEPPNKETTKYALKSPTLQTKTNRVNVCPGVADNACYCVHIAQHNGPTMPIHTPLDMRASIPSKRIHELRQKALEAAKRHKTFTIRGCFYSIRRGLQQRGWVERMDVHRRMGSNYNHSPAVPSPGFVCPQFSEDIPERKPGESKRAYVLKCERNIISRFLEHKPIDFLWACRKERTDWDDMNRNPGMQISRFHKKPFTSKSGMCAVLRDFHWHFMEGTAELYYPRCYNVFQSEDLDEFVEDFRMSACIALLRTVVECRQLQEECHDAAGGGANRQQIVPVVPASTVRFAIEQCRKFLNFRRHDDIDDADAVMPASVAATSGDHRLEFEWDLMLRHHQQLTVEGGRLAQTEELRHLILNAQRVLGEVAAMWPQYNLDGWHNIWIVKPSNRCRGRGIRLMNDMHQIRELVLPPATGRWVVQKYIGECCVYSVCCICMLAC